MYKIYLATYKCTNLVSRSCIKTTKTNMKDCELC